ncbi:uncharacterized protein LOC119085393 [Bradysia coprophila]|uniref:uncharacterized protein LOC119085393 n=1 Tax=Bradysia coprophila TaxID=38358 RepID=UPI00187DB462|nr:uncharacterized protein LOC119085393 [Bradysia coprophila]XP_037051686.1 uncharacterized protein LOC119085393 [Bradysia coprophila]
MKKCENDLKLMLSGMLLEQFVQSQRLKEMNLLQEHKKVHIKKYEKLMSVQHPDEHVFKLDNVLNLTDVTLPRDFMKLLSLGPQLALPVTRDDVKFPHLIADIEKIMLFDCPTELMDETRAVVTNHITNYINEENKIDGMDRFLHDTHRRLDKFLQRNKHIVVLNSDKCKRTVIMFRSEYESKMQSLLDDESTYEMKPINPVKDLMKTSDMLAQRLLDEMIINRETFKQFNCVGSTLPRISGLPKAHKDGIPLRPVVDTTNSPAYELSKFMNDILKHLVDNSKYNVKNAFEFKEFINDVRIPRSQKLWSIDAVSLYTNTDVKHVRKIIERQWNKIRRLTKMSKPLFFDVLDFCIDGSAYFTYNDIVYKQKEGLAMGLSLAPTLADIYLTELFDTCLPRLSYKPVFLKKYVDDVSSTVPESKINETLHIFNTFSTSGRLKFTHELECDRKINFLDLTLIHRTDNKVITNWFHKDISSNRMLSFLSNHPASMKQNIIISFAKRVLVLSDPIFKGTNYRRIAEILKQNQYPMTMIKKAILTANESIINASSTIPTVQPPEPPIYRSVPYVPELTHKIQRQLKKVNTRLRSAPKTITRLRNIYSNMKTKTPKMIRKGIVYRIKCKKCSTFYIGETKRCLCTRTKEHDYDFRSRFNPGSKTALVRHCLDNATHEPDFDEKELKILDVESDWYKRKTLEACYIWLYGDSAQNFKSLNMLHATYTNVMNSFKQLHVG